MDETRGEDASDVWTETILDSALIFATASTLAYWIVLISRLPAIAWYPVALAIIAVLVHTSGALRWRLPPADRMVAGLAAVGLAAAAMNVFTLRPDWDDFNFFQRALVVVAHPWQPIEIRNTGFDLPDLPAISSFHLMASYEVSTALVAAALGAPPLAFFHYGAGSIGAFIVPLSYFLLLRKFGFPAALSVIGAAGVLAFLGVSGDAHWDWGNFTIIRIWQGKCLLMALHLPLCWLYVSRFQTACKARRSLAPRCRHGEWYRPFGIGLFLLPWVVASAACGHALVDRLARAAILRALQCLGVAVAVIVVVLLGSKTLGNELTDTSVWQVSRQWTPWDSLSLVMSPRVLPLSLLILAVGLMVARDRRTAAACALGVAGSVLLLVLPWTSAILVKVAMGAYFRFAYTIPLPLSFGLLVAALFGWIADGRQIRSLLKAAALGLLVLAFVSQKTFALRRDVLALPSIAKFQPVVLPGTLRIAERLPPSAVVLAPERIVVLLGLLRPDTRFISTRPLETLHVFRNAGQPMEAERRVALQNAVTDCIAPAPNVNVAKRDRIDAIVLDPNCGLQEIPGWLSALAGAGAIFRADGESISRR